MNKLITILLIPLYYLSFVNSLFAGDAIVGGLSNKNVAINTNFVGSDILIFGSIKRLNYNDIMPSDVIIEVVGPRLPVTVRKKKKKLGIWINSDPIEIPASPTFYALVSTQNHKLILDKAELKKYNIGIGKISSLESMDPEYGEAVDATIRIRQSSGAYNLENISLKLIDDTLFSANIALPSNLREGDYEAFIYLVQNKKVSSVSKDVIKVRKIGLEKVLYNTAHDHPLFYGFFSIFLALISGWAASAIFRRFQQ